MKLLTLLKILITLLFSSVGYSEKVDSVDYAKNLTIELMECMKLSHGLMEKNTYSTIVSGRWVFYKGKIMSKFIIVSIIMLSQV